MIRPLLDALQSIAVQKWERNHDVTTEIGE